MSQVPAPDSPALLRPDVESRARAAVHETTLTLALIVGIAFVISQLVPSRSSRGDEPKLVFLILGTGVFVGLGLLRSLAEMTKGGTLFERRQSLRRVRLDGTPMTWGDWWRRHWPSALILAYLAFLLFSYGKPLVPARYRPSTPLTNRWFQGLWTWVGLAVLIPVIAGYIVRERRPTTLLVVRPSRRLLGGRRGFDVIPAEAVEEAEEADAG